MLLPGEFQDIDVKPYWNLNNSFMTGLAWDLTH